jgi:large subunit ribosomal protein L10
VAISKQTKDEQVKALVDLLTNAKGSAFAGYQGLSVADMQNLRREAKASGVKIKVVKNRLVRVALAQIESLKSVETESLKGQLLYAFSDSDEVAPSQVLFNFAKGNQSLVLTGGISPEGKALNDIEVKTLAELPSKEVQIAGVVNTLMSQVTGVVNAIGGNLGGLVQALEAKASS